MLGRYALYQELASGGIGSVCLARMRAEAGFARIMAVKRLHPHHAKDAQFVTMFLDEARMAARVRHPNVVSVLDVVSADDELFLVMEYVAGESLSKLLATARERRARIDPAIAVSIMSGVLEGLNAAHLATNERGVPLHIVHRDVSPQNVLVGSDGIARVVDFGIAKAVGRLQESTQTGQIKGKLVYMPPEQFSGGKLVDRRSDVWAASVLLWEMLVGRQLFPETADALRYHGGEELARPSELGAPEVLDDVVMKGLSRQMDERFQTARELLVAMERAVAPAPARRVAQWMQKLAREVLLKRAAYVEEIEAEAARTSAALAAAPARPVAAAPAPLLAAEPAGRPSSAPAAPSPPPHETLLSAGDVSSASVASVEPSRRRALGTWLALAVLMGGVGSATFHPAVRSRIIAKRAAAPPPSGPPSAAPVAGPADDAAAQVATQAAPPASSEARVEAPPPTSTGKHVRAQPGRQPVRAATPARPAPGPTVQPRSSADPLDLKSRE